MLSDGTYGSAAQQSQSDRLMAGLQNMLNAQEFKTAADVDAFMRRWVSETGGVIPQTQPQTPLEWAQALVDQAKMERDEDRAFEMAQTALETSADCVDAYLMLARLEPALVRCFELLEEAVAAGRRVIGEEQFESLRGHFWLAIETRPYMRALHELSVEAGAVGNAARAIAGLTEMLELNPHDNLGARFDLRRLLLTSRTPEAYAALHRLFERYRDGDAGEAYDYALLLFQETGASPEAARAFKKATRMNRHVPGVMLGTKTFPEDMDEARPGNLAEAIDYCELAEAAWSQTPGVAAWMRGL